MQLTIPQQQFDHSQKAAGRFLTLMSSLGPRLGSLLGQTSPSGRQNNTEDCKRSLSDVIENQIIPRLVQSHRVQQGLQPPSFTPAISSKKVAAFVALSQSIRTEETTDFIDEMLSQGVTTERIFLELIAPAARLLGQMWEQDQVDFAQVTCGLVRMHEITHRLGFEYQSGPQVGGDVQRIMLASAPGSQHFLGMTIVSDFFRKAGWDVVVEISVSEKELMHAAKNEWFDAIGISCATQAQLKDLPRLIKALKSASTNPETGILLGGPIFTVQSHHAKTFGADGICIDVNEAVALANSFKSRLA